MPLSKEIFEHLEEAYGLEYTLLDLGAAGSAYPAFEPLLPISHLIEVDPDARDFSGEQRPAKKYTAVREAICDSDEASTLLLYLTSGPHCSSSLLPNADKVGEFSYADLFAVEKEVELPATSLNRLAARLGVQFDWIKLDTQGTEKRILDSLSDELASNLVAIDVELGLNEHYVGQDIFSGFHETMLNRGYVLESVIRTQTRPRIKPADLARVKEHGLLEHQLYQWPTAIEVRYLRTIRDVESIRSQKHLLKVWGLKFALGDYAYCYHLAQLARDSDLDQQLGKLLLSSAVQRLEEAARKDRSLRSRVGRRIRRLLGQ